MSETCKECTVPSKINKVLYILVAFAIIFFFSAILNDETGLSAKHKIRLPVFGMELESSKIFEIGPIIIIFLALCLHVFVQLWYHCDKNEYDKEICLSRVDFITGNLVREVLFFGLPPFVLLLFHINSRGKSDHLLTGIYFLTGAFFLLYLRLLYTYTKKRKYLSIAVIILFMVSIGGLCTYKDELDIVKLYPLDLRGVNLSGQILLKANLQNMKAEAANFENSTLFEKSLQGAVAQHAIFSDANLFRAIFRDSDFGSAKFIKADLGQTTIERTEFTCAVLSRANLKDAKIIESNFEAAKLEEANISGSEIKESIFRYANLEKAKFENAQIILSDFKEANLKGVEFKETTIKFTDMSGAHLNEADFSGARLEGVILKNSDLSGAKHLTYKQLVGACIDINTKMDNIELKNKLKQCTNYQKFIEILHRAESY